MTTVNADGTASADRPRSHRTAETIKRELELLAKRHSRLLVLGDENVSTKKRTKDRKKVLEARHASSEFHGNQNIEIPIEDSYYLSLFDEFARLVCQTKVIARKELFECWAMALYVHFYFPPSQEDDERIDDEDQDPLRANYYHRIADMGCGQGLVSWAILFLDKSRSRTAIGIDKKIPKTCDVIEKVMTECYPHIATFKEKQNDDHTVEEEGKTEDTEPSTTGLEENSTRAKRERTAAIKRWHWVEGDICKNVSADSSTLIIGVHCCGTLSDTILDLAISSKSALALVPCCHTRKSLSKEYIHNPKKFDDLLAKNAKKNMEIGNGKEILPTTLTDYIDKNRIKKLINAGFEVKEEQIPSVITPKNRIIVATPPPVEDVLTGDCDPVIDDSDDGIYSQHDSIDDSNLLPITGTKQQHKKFVKGNDVFSIPLADTPHARSIVASQSGRLAADLRQRRPPPSLSLSLYLPDPDKSMTAEKLNEFSDAIALQEQHKHFPDECQNPSDGNSSGDFSARIIQTHVDYGAHGPFAHPEEGRFSRNYRICYEVNDPTGRLPQISKVQAKALHRIVCKRIMESAFPGISLRQGIK